eukprot:TRINITY_DN26808_c0_g1_i1.p1 TRINITY_DN26808_c0_g1~~TRINITY_DN26808_c0_g1_i1.p1  ORF type:complete len:186 (+),score=59.98 TRINITY_DN26808_c0_g1_i1:61-558(+)
MMSPLVLGLYVVIGFVYAGFGFLLKGLQVQPQSGIASFVVALLPQLYIARRYVGRERAADPKKKKKKVRMWTFSTIMSRFLPIIMASSVIAGLMGASGVVGAMQVTYVSGRLARQVLRCVVVLLPSLMAWRYFRDMIDGETVPVNRDAPAEESQPLLPGETKKNV